MSRPTTHSDTLYRSTAYKIQRDSSGAGWSLAPRFGTNDSLWPETDPSHNGTSYIVFVLGDSRVKHLFNDYNDSVAECTR